MIGLGVGAIVFAVFCVCLRRHGEAMKRILHRLRRKWNRRRERTRAKRRSDGRPVRRRGLMMRARMTVVSTVHAAVKAVQEGHFGSETLRIVFCTAKVFSHLYGTPVVELMQLLMSQLTCSVLS